MFYQRDALIFAFFQAVAFLFDDGGRGLADEAFIVQLAGEAGDIGVAGSDLFFDSGDLLIDIDNTGQRQEDIDAADMRLGRLSGSGKAGGFSEKIQACRKCGIPAIVIARPADDGLSYDEVLELCRRKMK